MPLLKESDFKKHISSKEFKNVYLVYGEEKYLVKLYTDKLIEQIVGKHPNEFNYHIFSSRSFDIEKLNLTADIIPFMSEYNCIKLEDIDIEAMINYDFDDLKKIVSACPQSTVMVFTMLTLDKDFSKTGKFKQFSDLVQKIGIVAEMGKRTSLSLEKELMKWADSLGSKLSSINAGKLVEYCSADIQTLKNEVSKLAAYADGGEITIDMIRSMTPINLEAKIFSLADYVIDGKADSAFKQLETLIYQKESEISIIAALGNVYIDAYRMKASRESGITEAQTAKDFNYKNRAFLLSKAAKRAGKLSIETLRDCINAIAETDVRFKSTSVNKPIALEQLISRLLMYGGKSRR